MSGGGRSRPEAADSPVEGDAESRIAQHLAERGGDRPADPGEVPAGGAGADSGAASAVGVEPGSRSTVPDDSTVPDESTHNDDPGIGTRRPDVDEGNREDGDPGRRA